MVEMPRVVTPPDDDEVGAVRIPVAAYSAETPYRDDTDWPLTWLMTYQPDPDLLVGHVADQAPPVAVPVTVSVLLMPSLTLAVAPVVAPVRRLMPSQPGTSTVPAGEPVGAGGVVGVGATPVGVGVGVGVDTGVGTGVGVAIGVGGGAVGAGTVAPALRTPVAAYSAATPYRAETGCPLTWLIRYQLDPDFQPGQLVPQVAPVTVAETVTVLASDSDVLMVALVDVLVRRFTPEQAGT